MSALDQTGTLLVQLELLREQQWHDACLKAGTNHRLEPILEALREQPAWWANPERFTPALTSYQRKQILRRSKKETPNALRASLRLNDFLLLEMLGKGGMAIVYKCWDLVHQRFVAVKRIKKDLPILRKRFQREIEVMSRLHHPAITAFLGSGTAHGSALLVMECLRGPTLRAEVEARHPIPWREVVGWFIPLLDALEHAHKHGVIHRDIKPGNIILHREAKRPVAPKLLDMGLATSLESAAALRGGAKGESVTQAGQLVGTIDYMAPEQWVAADKAVPESDLYTLGGSLYFALAGKPPFGFGGTDRIGPLCMAHTNTPPPSIRAVRPDVPDLLDLLIQQMLSKTPARRGSPSALRPQFQQLHRQAPASPAPVASPARTGEFPIQAQATSPAVSGSHALKAAGQRPPATKPADSGSMRRVPASGTQEELTEEPAAPRPQATNPRRTASVMAPPSVINSTSQKDVGRVFLALLLGTGEWLFSLLRPWEYPLRFLLAAGVITAVVLKYLRVW
jgi:serine/threonine-protein kinase